MQISSEFQPKSEHLGQNLVQNISDYEDFRNALNASMREFGMSEAQQISINAMVSASFFAANARNSALQTSLWDANERINDFKNASKSLKIALLQEQIDILKAPKAIQKGLFLGQSETISQFNDRKNEAVSYLKQILAEI